MARKSINTVKTALIELLALIRSENGYGTTINPENIRGVYDPAFLNSTVTETYPRCVVMLDMGTSARRVAGAISETISFIVVFTVRKTTANQNPPVEQCQAFIDDLSKLIADNQTLKGTVATSELVEWTTDQGVRGAEGIALAYITTERDVR